jgi:hypothetical protein
MEKEDNLIPHDSPDTIGDDEVNRPVDDGDAQKTALYDLDCQPNLTDDFHAMDPAPRCDGLL